MTKYGVMKVRKESSDTREDNPLSKNKLWVI